MLYLGEQDLDTVFAYVADRYGRQEEVPHYRAHKEGVEKFLGVLQHVQSDTYYPTLLDKATYLLVSVNKGHFFSNGNKRLALVTMTTFLAINDCDLQKIPKDEYRELLKKLFPEYPECMDFEQFSSTDFATYNLSIIIADSGTYSITFDALKERVRAFLAEALA